MQSILLALNSNLGSAENATAVFDEDGNLVVGLADRSRTGEQQNVPALASRAIRTFLFQTKGISVFDYYIAYNRDHVIFNDNLEREGWIQALGWLSHQFRLVLTVCSAVQKGRPSSLDFTWTDTNRIMAAADNFNIPYLHADASPQTFLKVMETYLRARGANDVVYIFDSPENADMAIYFLITESQLRNRSSSIG
ncbi:hypothetical protein quinque_014908 [Culex quinquefasciatus]